MEPMVTAPPRTARDDGRVRVTSEVSGRSPLWFSVDERYAELLGDRSDHVAVGLLMPAMKEGRDLHIGGMLTDSLLHQCNGDLQRLLRLIHPDLREITVSADASAPPPARAAGVAAGFSGGVDSFATLSEYFWADDAPESLRITHLLNDNVGAHGHHGDALWRARRAPLETAAAEFGLPFVTVDSNLDEHYPRIGFIESVTMRNATVPHLLGAGIGHLHLASAIPFSAVRIDSSGEIARFDPFLVPLLSTSAVTVSSANSALTRVQKTLALIGRPEARYLDVCTDDDPRRTRNCSSCSKCMRAMLTLEMAGHLDEFCPQTFSLEPYLRNRDGFIASVLSSDEPYPREIREYAKEVGWHWRAADRRRGFARRVRQTASAVVHELAALPALRPLRRALRR